MSPRAFLLATLTVLLNGAAQLLLREAALGDASPLDPLSLATNAWFVGGVATYAVSVLTWLAVLGTTPLAVATPFVSIVYVAVPIASRQIFGDTITMPMAAGMLLVVAGVTLVATGGRRADRA